MTPMIYPPASWKPECPVCQQSFNRDKLAQHIRQEHRKVPLVPLAKALYTALGQGIPHNLDSIEFDELAEVVANICKDAKNKQELKKLRRQRSNF